SFPTNAIEYCLTEARITNADVDYVVFYEKPVIKFDRLVSTYVENAPKGYVSFISNMLPWAKRKLLVNSYIRKVIKSDYELLFTKHHKAHAAAAFYNSNYSDAAIITIDGVGEWDTTTTGLGCDNQVSIDREIHFPHSLGLLYSSFTYQAGFRVNSGEYKLMGLAPFGEPVYFDKILSNLVNVKADGSYQLNLEYFDYRTGSKMTNHKFDLLFDGKPRTSDETITKREMNLAASAQKALEYILLKMTNSAYEIYKTQNLCLSGGVALNCVANRYIFDNSKFKNLYVYPAAGDAGAAVGAALTVWYEYLDNSRTDNTHHGNSASQSMFLGPSYDTFSITDYDPKLDVEEYDLLNLTEIIASLILEDKIVGWFQGRMEFGPRALGNRSILANAYSPKMKDLINSKIKYREPFRPFAASILDEDYEKCFDIPFLSPYMLFTTKANDDKFPAVLHVDGTSRIQTVTKDANLTFHSLLHEIKKKTGVGIVLNTSLNVRGEPIINRPEEAIKLFKNTDLDILVINNQVIKKG
ncbi:MAG: hypothetical protein HOI47_13185, partial [Candidatus Scalindua sp.]|nr:hypothetical protein [Candidatus Scalindua sp.]